MNHLHPPFDNPKIRQAVMTAMSQEDYMRAIVGDDDTLWKTLPGFFTPGTPLYTDARLFGEHGIPAVLYGAGPRTVLESNAKRADENLLLDDLRRATKVVARVLADLLPA